MKYCGHDYVGEENVTQIVAADLHATRISWRLITRTPAPMGLGVNPSRLPTLLGTKTNQNQCGILYAVDQGFSYAPPT